MTDSITIKKILEKINKDEAYLNKLVEEAKKIWEDTGLDQNDPSYLVEKTMRFEMAHEKINKIFDTYKEHIQDYKRLCAEISKQEE